MSNTRSEVDVGDEVVAAERAYLVMTNGEEGAGFYVEHSQVHEAWEVYVSDRQLFCRVPDWLEMAEEIARGIAASGALLARQRQTVKNLEKALREIGDPKGVYGDRAYNRACQALQGGGDHE